MIDVASEQDNQLHRFKYCATLVYYIEESQVSAEHEFDAAVDGFEDELTGTTWMLCEFFLKEVTCLPSTRVE